jgi:endonuclease/exonuclease/phosphatase family metal-dependent hydrolase
MMRKIKLAIFLLTFTACRTVTPQLGNAALRSNSDQLTERPLFMVANVENAFDGKDNGQEYPEFQTSSSNWSPEMAEKKAIRVAKVFSAAKCPEIIVSPEVENQYAADLIVNASKKAGCTYKGYSANKTNKQPIGVAIFTSRPVSRESLIEIAGVRPHLRIDFADGLTVIGVHLKSKRNGGGDAERAAGADAIKTTLSSFTGRRMIVAGDFNTEDDLLAGTKLVNCTEHAEPTHVYRRQWHKLDKIYSTQCAKSERFNAPFLMKDGHPYRSVESRDTGYTTHEDEGYSDHIPLLMWK